MDFHARAAGIGENDFDAFALEGGHEDIAPEHGRADFRARGAWMFFSLRAGDFAADLAVAVVLLIVFLVVRLARPD